METFLQHLSDPAPGFRCYRPGGDPDQADHLVSVHHELADAAGDDALATVRQLFGTGSEELEALYAQHNGLTLYVDGFTAGVRIFDLASVMQHNEDWREWLDPDEEELFDYQRFGTAFGEIDSSGNYFVLWQGRVYYSDHDMAEEGAIADSLSSFLDAIAAAPARFLYEAGCYTRYGEEQWIPGAYLPDVGPV